MVTAGYAFGQGNENTVQGARSAGMGNTSVCLSDSWAILNNIGALNPDSLRTEAAVSGTGKFGTAHAGNVAMAITGRLPNKNYSFGAGVVKFGSPLYSETRVTAGIARKINHINMGLALNYVQNYTEGMSSKNTVLAEAGGTVLIMKKLLLAAHAYNITASSIGTERYSTVVPQTLRTGIAFIPFKSNELILTGEAAFVPRYPALFRAGLEYRIIEALAVRLGTEPTTSAYSCGIGVFSTYLCVDCGLNIHPELGISSSLALKCNLKDLKLWGNTKPL